MGTMGVASPTWSAASSACDAMTAAPAALVARARAIALVTPIEAPIAAPDAAPARTDDPEALRRRIIENRTPPELILLGEGFTLLEVLEYLKGEGPDRVMIALSPEDAGRPEAHSPDFERHTADGFWNDPEMGRVGIGEDCRPTGAFAEGQEYLVFFGEPHVKGYERIVDPDDAWLAWVRTQLTSID